MNMSAILDCHGDLLFRKSDQPVTNEQIKSMPNSTLVGSAKGCARVCYSSQSCNVMKWNF